VLVVQLLVFELSIKVMRYDPPLKSLFKYTTPREFVVWGHRLFPIVVFASVSIKKVFFIDMDEHHQKVLHLLARKNQVRLCSSSPGDEPRRLTRCSH
jgi:hypothetical protein